MTQGVTVLVASLAHSSGLPEDVVNNVFHFNQEATVSSFEDFCDAVISFYNDIPSLDTVPIAEWMSDSLDRSADACKVSMYIQDDPTGVADMGSPVFVKSFTLAPENNQAPLPEEVSTVISYHGDLDGVPAEAPNPTPPPATIRPQSRMRGRLYIGPLNVTCGTTVTDFYRPNQAWRDRLNRALSDLWAFGEALPDDQYFGIWSKADGEVHRAVGSYVDDAWDTQRRRGVPPTTRSTVTFPV